MTYEWSANLCSFSGGGHEEVIGRGLRRCGQPHFLQPEHGHVAWRCQEIMRWTAHETERTLQIGLKQQCNFLYRMMKYTGNEPLFYFKSSFGISLLNH